MIEKEYLLYAWEQTRHNEEYEDGEQVHNCEKSDHSYCSFCNCCVRGGQTDPLRCPKRLSLIE